MVLLRLADGIYVLTEPLMKGIQTKRVAINEDFDPDESCLFDVYQEKCLPSPITDECPEDFETHADGY